jgi:hypothetical protein
MEPKYNWLKANTKNRIFITLSLVIGMGPETVPEITDYTSYNTFKKYLRITSKVKHQEMTNYWKIASRLKLVNSA